MNKFYTDVPYRNPGLLPGSCYTFHPGFLHDMHIHTLESYYPLRMNLRCLGKVITLYIRQGH